MQVETVGDVSAWYHRLCLTKCRYPWSITPSLLESCPTILRTARLRQLAIANIAPTAVSWFDHQSFGLIAYVTRSRMSTSCHSPPKEVCQFTQWSYSRRGSCICVRTPSSLGSLPKQGGHHKEPVPCLYDPAMRTRSSLALLVDRVLCWSLAPGGT